MIIRRLWISSEFENKWINDNDRRMQTAYTGGVRTTFEFYALLYQITYCTVPYGFVLLSTMMMLTDGCDMLQSTDFGVFFSQNCNDDNQTK